MHREVVRRRWLGERDFLDLVAAANVLPGPNSTELALFLGRARAGWRGLVVAGALFIVPAAVLSLALAELYLRAGRSTVLDAALYGVRPAMLAIVAVAAASLARATLRDAAAVAVTLVAAILALAGLHELAVLALGGALVAGARTVAARVAEPVSLLALAAVMAKIGLTLYGTGYVLLAYLRADVVERLGWLDDAQLLDAIAIGQATPGPVLSTATAVGHFVAGVPGAIVATVAIFAPAFAFVLVADPIVAAARARPSLRAALDGVAAAALGLVLAVGTELARAALVDGVAVVIGAVALVALARIGAGWVLLAAAVAGVAVRG